MPSVGSALRDTVRANFPSAWVRWQEFKMPSNAEVEAQYLQKLMAPTHVAVDIGANYGFYTRRLSRLCSIVHAFEPAAEMARLLRRTSASNVIVHECALSNATGEGSLFIPKTGRQTLFGLATLNSQTHSTTVVQKVKLDSLDSIALGPIHFIKIDVEGHELETLDGCVTTIESNYPVFLVETENRHKSNVVADVFLFFEKRNYVGYFIAHGRICELGHFDAKIHQDISVMDDTGARLDGSLYINNFFFFPHHLNGRKLLGAISQ
jgi:FkbM family methyltransferase